MADTPLPVYTFPHPDRKKDLDRMFERAHDGRQDAQQRLDASTWMCCNPTCNAKGKGYKGETALKVCGRCKFLRYCSKECQMQHWPQHKPVCGPGVSTVGLVKNLLDPQTTHDAVYVELGMTLADITLFYMGTRDSEDPSKHKGMLEVLSVNHAPGSILQAECREDVARARQKLNNSGEVKGHVVPVHFVCDKARGQGIFQVMGIPPQILERVRKAEPFPMKSGLAGYYEIPFSKENVIQVINMQISSDKENRLRLRSKLTPRDVEIMRDRGLAV